MASKRLKLPMTDLCLFSFIGTRYFAIKAAERIAFSSIVFPPAFTPVIINTFLEKSTLTGFGLCSAGCSKPTSLISLFFSALMMARLLSLAK